MSFGIGNKIEMRRRALLEAIRFCGGVTAYSRCLKVSRARASNWCNKPEIEIPYEYAVMTEEITQVSIERLSPYTEAANKIMRRLRSKDKLPLISVDVNTILMGDNFYSTYPNANRPIIIGTDGVLISGLMQFQAQKSSKQKKIQVTIVDLEAIVLGERSLKEMNIGLLISEKVAIGIRLEQLLGKNQNKRNDFHNAKQQLNKNVLTEDLPCLLGDKKNIVTEDLFCRPGDKVVRNDSYIASLIGLGSKDTYRRAKKVCLHGSLELIHAMDNNNITIKEAAQSYNCHQQSNESQLMEESC